MSPVVIVHVRVARWEFLLILHPKVLYAKYAANIAFEATVLALTVSQTLVCRRAAALAGIHNSFYSLLVRDGKPWRLWFSD